MAAKAAAAELAPDPMPQDADADELLTDHELAQQAISAQTPSMVTKATAWLTDQPLAGKTGNSTPGRVVGALFTWQLIVLAILVAGGAWWYLKKKK